MAPTAEASRAPCGVAARRARADLVALAVRRRAAVRPGRGVHRCSACARAGRGSGWRRAGRASAAPRRPSAWSRASRSRRRSRSAAGCCGLPGGEVLDPLAGGPVPLSAPLSLIAGGARRSVRIVARFARRGRARSSRRRSWSAIRSGSPRRCAPAAGPAQEVLVLPRTEPVRWTRRGARRRARAASGGGRRRAARGGRRRRAAARTGPGTPASRIHWPALARGAGLLERRLRADGDTRPLVVLDARGARPAEQLDAAVRAAASLALALARARRLRAAAARRPAAAAIEPDLARLAGRARPAGAGRGRPRRPRARARPGGRRRRGLLRRRAAARAAAGRARRRRRTRPRVLVVPAALPRRAPARAALRRSPAAGSGCAAPAARRRGGAAGARARMSADRAGRRARAARAAPAAAPRAAARRRASAPACGWSAFAALGALRRAALGALLSRRRRARCSGCSALALALAVAPAAGSAARRRRPPRRSRWLRRGRSPCSRSPASRSPGSRTCGSRSPRTAIGRASALPAGRSSPTADRPWIRIVIAARRRRAAARRGADAGLRAPRRSATCAAPAAALPLVALAVVPSTLVRPQLPYLQGLLLFALLAAFMWGERVAPRDGGRGRSASRSSPASRRGPRPGARPAPAVARLRGAGGQRSRPAHVDSVRLEPALRAAELAARRPRGARVQARARPTTGRPRTSTSFDGAAGSGRRRPAVTAAGARSAPRCALDADDHGDAARRCGPPT